MGLRAMLQRSARHAADAARAEPPPIGRSLSRADADEHGATDSDDASDAEANAETNAETVADAETNAAAPPKPRAASVVARAARLSATAAARITRLVGENPPMGSSARVVRKQYQSIVKERSKEYKNDDKDHIDAVALYEIEFPKQPANGSAHAASPGDNCPLGIDLETDFYGKHAVVKDVKRGSMAYALYKTGGTRVLRAGHIIVAVNGLDLSQLSFTEVLQELKSASAPRVIRFLDPNILPFEEYKHEPSLVNRDQYGFAKDDRYILNYRKHLRKRKLMVYDHERQWAEFVQQQGGMDEIDRLLHDATADPASQTKRAAVLAELRALVLKGIPAMLRPRVWGVLTGVSSYRSAYSPDYFAQLVDQIDGSPSISDIEKDIHRTYPEHPFFQSEQGRRELKNVLGAYSLHNPYIGYCQSMNFIAGMMLLFMDEEDAFWLFCAMMEKRYLPEENYTQSMVGTQTDQLVFKELVAQELPQLAERLEFCGIQIQLVTLHWFLCAFVCTLPTESALRVWDWFCLDGQEVLFITAIGILKKAEPRIMAATLHSDLHTIVRELGTDLHDDDAFMSFLYGMAPPSDIERREAELLFEQAWDGDNDDSSGSRSSSSGGSGEAEEGGDENEPSEEVDDTLDQPPPKEHPPVAWAASATTPVKTRRRKRTIVGVPAKINTLVRGLMESKRKTSNSRPSGEYQKHFTMQDITSLRAQFRPQFEKKTTNDSN